MKTDALQRFGDAFAAVMEARILSNAGWERATYTGPGLSYRDVYGFGEADVLLLRPGQAGWAYFGRDAGQGLSADQVWFMREGQGVSRRRAVPLDDIRLLTIGGESLSLPDSGGADDGFTVTTDADSGL